MAFFSRHLPRLQQQLPASLRVDIRSYAGRPTYYQGISKRRPTAAAARRNPVFYQRLNSIDPKLLVYGLIGLNCGVFGLWAWAENEAQRFRDPRKLMGMMKNWSLSEQNITSGRVWTLVTSTFSHRSADHLLFNMIGLFFLGLPTAQMIGSAAFMGLYLSTGVASGLAFLGFNRLFGPRQRVRDVSSGQIKTVPAAIEANGASGSVYGVMAYFAALQPRATFLIFFVLPCPAWAAVSGLVAWDVYRAAVGTSSNVASSAHVGGALSGLAFCLLTRGRLRF